MPKRLTGEQAGDAIGRSYDAEKKAKEYGTKERVNRIFGRRGSFGPPGANWNAEADAAKHMANMYESEAEDLRKRAEAPTNSRAQYELEKEQGDPYALRMSYEEWKKL